jgi:23S rRNA (adenine2503-C2)-methyltransferase
MSNLLGLSHASLSALLAARGAAPYRLSQLLRALYSSPRASAVSSLLCFSAAERASLSAAGVSIDGGAVADERRSADGTVKWLISLPEPQRAQSVETVFIPPLPGSGEGGGDDSEDEAEDSVRRPRAPRGGTLCVSSQAGCSLRCAFCHTGTQAMTGNLPAAAIVAKFAFS